MIILARFYPLFFPLQGLCHEMYNFFEGPKSHVLSVYALVVFKIFGALLYRKYKFKFLLASMKTHLQILKILTETLFKIFVSAFRKPPLIL
jgi:hypothetical protein